MKFTEQNFRTAFPKAGIKDSDLVKRYELASKSEPEDYENSATVRRMIDLFVSQLNERYEKSDEKKGAEKISNAPKLKKTVTKKESKPDNSEKVNKILPEIGFINRYCSLHGKTLLEKKDTGIRILASLQKAIIEKVIRKNSPYANEINKIQNNLIKISEMRKSDAVIDIDDIDRLRAIGKSQSVDPVISVIKAFISIQGKEGVKEKAQRLLEKIKTINQDGQKSKIVISLSDYIAGRTATPEIDALTLQGFYGLSGVEYTPPKSGINVNSMDLLGASFKTVPFTGRWREFIGMPSDNFRIMLYGKPGSGKSTLALEFAGYLSKRLCKKVLYVAGEEKIGGTLQEKIIRLNVANSNLVLNDKIPASIVDFDVVFIDSVNTLLLNPEDLAKMPKGKAYVYLFKTTKDGNYRGSQEFEHDVDTVIEVTDMKAIMHKNRFGGKIKEFKING